MEIEYGLEKYRVFESQKIKNQDERNLHVLTLAFKNPKSAQRAQSAWVYPTPADIPIYLSRRLRFVSVSA